MVSVAIAVPYKDFKDKITIVTNLKGEMKKLKRKGEIEIDETKKCVACYYEEPNKFYN